MASVDTNNSILKGYENTKNQLLNDVQNNYNNMVAQTDQKYNEMIQSSKNYANEQSKIQQQKTDQAIAEINQNKDKTTNDYLKQQKGAYADYATQTNAYGVNAERQAAAGLQNSGYSESAKVNLYNTYQNRITSAKEVFNQAILAYDNQITQARIANNSALAEIAYNANQKQLELALQGFQYKNELLNNLTSQKLSISSQYDNLWQSQYKALLDEAQYNEDMAFKKAEAAREQANWEKTYALQKAAATKSSSSSRRSSRRSSSRSSRSSGTKLSGSNSSSLTNNNNSNVEKLANNITKMVNTKLPYMGNINKGLARQYVNQQYNNGKLTDSDAVYIFNKAGL